MYGVEMWNYFSVLHISQSVPFKWLKMNDMNTKLEMSEAHKGVSLFFAFVKVTNHKLS